LAIPRDPAGLFPSASFAKHARGEHALVLGGAPAGVFGSTARVQQLGVKRG
jgi:hypothetical protein